MLVFGQLAHEERAFLNRLCVVELQLTIFADGPPVLEVKVGTVRAVGLIQDGGRLLRWSSNDDGTDWAGAHLLMSSSCCANTQRLTSWNAWHDGTFASSVVECVVDAVESALGPLPFLHVDVGGGELCLLLHRFHLPILLNEVLD